MHPRQREKGKAPLVGPRTAKNQSTRDANSSTDSESDKQQPSPKPAKRPTKKDRKKPPTVVSSESELDDDQLGITPRTPPQSPFYRGPACTTSATVTTKTKQPSATTSKQPDSKRNKKEQSTNSTDPQQAQASDKTKTKKKKGRTGLTDLAEEQDKLYDKLNKTVRTSRSQ